MKYLHNSVIASCPACRSNIGKTLWEISADDAALHFVSPTEDETRYKLLTQYLTSIWKGGSCKVVRCSHCFFSFSFPYVCGDKNFYDLAYHREGYPKWKWEFDVSFNWIKTANKITPRILEIGAGDGSFLAALAKSITNIDNLEAIEYSEYGQKKIQSLKINCSSTDIRSINPKSFSEKFDYICLFQVLEHLDNIDELFNCLKNLLKENGEIIFAVPNDELIVFNELNDALLDMPPNHIGRWTKKAFEYVALRHDFTLSYFEKEPCQILPAIKLFLTYRFLRYSQKSGTIPHFIKYKLSKRTSNAARYCFYIFEFFRSLSAIIYLCLNSHKLGNSQLARLTVISRKS